MEKEYPTAGRKMNKGFWAIPKSISKREDLSFKAKLIAGVLWTRKNSDFQAFPSRRYMAEALGTSIKTIDRGIKELKEKALLEVKREGLGRNNRYYFPDWDSSDFPGMSSPEWRGLSTQERTGVSTPIVRDYIKDNTFVDDKTSSVKEVFSYFKDKVKAFKGFVPEIEWAKDGKLAKKRLKNYSLDEIRQLIDWYLDSKYCQRLGVSLAVCLSSLVINLWKTEKASSFSFERLYPRWKPKI
ncbi:MAG: helix-turn-helix domain-containing protein [Nitrospirota bacterium]